MDVALEELRIAVASESSDGSLIVVNVADNPVCSILLNPTVPCLLLSWRKNATSLQLRFILEHVLEILEAARLDKIVGDDGGILSFSAADQAWVARNWMPRAMHRGLRAIATVVPFAYSGRLALEPIHASAPAGLALRSFESVDEAKRWLRNERVAELAW